MSEISERNFATFELGDNVYHLADGLIPEMAEMLDVKLGGEPNSKDLQDLMNKVGPNKVVRTNEEITAIDRPTMVRMIHQGGLQKSVERSLRTPRYTNLYLADRILLMTCVANWQDEAERAVPESLTDVPVYILGGNRVMDTPTEVVNKNVARLYDTSGRYPQEAEYAASVILPSLVSRGFKVRPMEFETRVADEMFEGLFKQYPHFLNERLLLVRNANAGIVSGFQMREQAQKISADFDTDPTKPQAYVVTPSKELAPSPAEDAPEYSAQYQKVGTALRPIALTALKVHQAGGGE